MDAEFKFRCEQEEKDLLFALAKEVKIAPSEYLRLLIKNREKPIVRETWQAKRVREEEIKSSIIESCYNLGKVGVNLNQVAHYLNLEHLKALDVNEPTIEKLLLIDRLNSSDLTFIRENLSVLDGVTREIQTMIKELLANKPKSEDALIKSAKTTAKSKTKTEVVLRSDNV